MGDVRASQSDSALLRSLFPDVPEVPFVTGLQTTLDWFTTLPGYQDAHAQAAPEHAANNRWGLLVVAEHVDDGMGSGGRAIVLASAWRSLDTPTTEELARETAGVAAGQLIAEAPVRLRSAG